MQDTTKDSKEVYERGPALVIQRNMVLEQHAVKGGRGCDGKSKMERDA